MPEFADNKGTLPHAVNVKKLEHFQGVAIPVTAQRKSIDILIGQSDKSLLTVRAREKSEKINTFITPIASKLDLSRLLAADAWK